ncbi:MAG: dephospho-CoA kinase, partial [Clostridiales bacterium]|nr:dephospho-CoA kinase [Clostridiales bacterium]
GAVFGADGMLDRKRLGSLVFQDERALADLNAITHAYVGDEVDRRLARAREEGRPAAAIDAIALIESGMGEKCDILVAVLASEEVRIRRIMAREGISEDYARLRVSAQKGADWFRARCDYVLESTETDTPAAFSARALALFRPLIEQG